MNEQLMTEAIEHGRTKWLRNLISERLPEIINEQNPSAIKQWDCSIKQFMRERGLIEPRQQKDYWTDLRNAISTFNPHHPALSLVGLSTEQWITINNTNRDKLQNRTTKLIDNPDTVVERAIALLDSPKWAEITAGLATVTGRRCSELLQTAHFSYSSPYSVIFTGATKRRTESTPLELEIPTLAPATQVISSIARLRELRPTDGLNLKQINQKYEEDVAAACHRHFHDLIPTRDGKDNLYTHIFRAVYATIAAHWFCPPTVPVLEFRAYIQGHFFLLEETDQQKRHSIATQRHYFDYQIGDGRSNLDGRLGIKLHNPDVIVISPFQRFHSTPTSSLTQKPQDNNSNSLLLPDALVERFNLICDRLHLKANSFVSRLELLATHLEQLPSAISAGSTPPHLSLDSTALQQVCASQHLLATALANLTSSPSLSIPTSLNHTQLSSPTEGGTATPKPSTSATTPSTKKPQQKPRPDKHALPQAHVHYVIDTILDYNNHPGRTHQDKWRIGVSLLKSLTTVNQNHIYQVLKERQAQIDRHHQLHQLKKSHNQKGYSATHVHDAIQVIPFSQFKQQWHLSHPI